MVKDKTKRIKKNGKIEKNRIENEMKFQLQNGKKSVYELKV